VLQRRTEGGSHYLALAGLPGGRVPRPDLSLAPRLFRALHRAIRAGLVASAHDLSEGGLAVAAAEMAFAGGLGLSLDLGRIELADLGKNRDPDATRLYSESCSRFLVEVAEGKAAEFERAFAGLPCAHVGSVLPTGRLALRGTGGGMLADVDVEDLRRAHQGSFRG
jgi:phosphoribosylformylglycinamidine synthase subunit PurSL